MKTTLYYNGIFHSGISETDTFSCMTVSGGRITGTYKKRPEGRFLKQVDLGGRHVYPCLIDCHIHMLFTIASMAMGTTLCNITSIGIEPHSIAGVEEKIKNTCNEFKSLKILVFKNYIRSAVDERRMPNRHELDKWCNGKAVVIYNIDGHSTAMSTAMMKLLGLSPENHNGIMEGEENERLQGRLTDIIAGQMGLRALLKGIARFQNTCAEYGISVVGALEGNGDSPKDPVTTIIARLSRHFDVGVRLYLQFRDIKRVEPFEKWMKHKRIGGCGDWEMDGASGSHSAAFSLPYTDTGSKASCYYSQEEANKLVASAVGAGYQIASHAIGDLAIARIVEALRLSDNKNIVNRIEHCEFLNDESLNEIIEKGYAVIMQPGYAWIDKRYLNTYTQCLDKSIRDRMKFRTLFESGIPLCGSSDSPVQEMDPYLQMLGMVEFYNEKESVSPYQAFVCYTKNASKALMEEDERGTLEVGKTADFFTSDRDLFLQDSEDLALFRPDGTYYGGKKYKKKTGSIIEFLGMLMKKPNLI